MKQLLSIALAGILVLGACQRAQQEAEKPATTDEAAKTEQAQAGEPSHEMAAPEGEQALLHKEDPQGTYGAGIVLKQATTIEAILAAPSEYEGKIVQVAGTVSEVCPRRGCWIDLAEGDEVMRVKVNDGEIVFPLSAKGNQAVVEGVVEKIDLDAEQAKAWKEHEAQELGVAFDPESVTGPMTIWRIAGLGARIDG
jgi:hypothetical protein